MTTLQAIAAVYAWDRASDPRLTVQVIRSGEDAGESLAHSSVPFFADELRSENVSSLLAALGYYAPGDDWSRAGAGTLVCRVKPVSGYLCPLWCMTEHAMAERTMDDPLSYVVVHERQMGAVPSSLREADEVLVHLYREDRIRAGECTPGRTVVSLLADGPVQLTHSGAESVADLMFHAATTLAAIERGEL